MKPLHKLIKINLIDLFNDTVESNIKGKGRAPLILSENDLCFHLLNKIYDKCNYEINTEVTIDDTKGYRHDIVIYDKSNSEYVKSGENPKYWEVDYYIAVIELKHNFTYYSYNKSRNEIFNDLKVLSEISNKTDLHYLIYFDFKGLHNKDELNDWMNNSIYKGIYFYYGDIKHKILYENGRMIKNEKS